MSALLADSGRLLTSSLDYDTTLRRVVRLAVPRLADWSVLYVPHRTETLATRVLVAHASPAREAVLRAIWHRQPFDLPEHHPLAQVARTAERILIAEASPAVVASLADGGDAEQALTRVGVHTLTVVPLVARDAPIGSLLLVGSRPSRPPFDQATLSIVDELARGAAHAIANAQLFAETKLALRLRDEVIAAASTEMLGLIEVVRGRTQTLRAGRDRRGSGRQKSVGSGRAAIDALTRDLEQIVRELRLVAEAPRAARKTRDGL
jgi:GAF domain-containing protein